MAKENIEAIKNIVNKVQGWLSDREGKFLYTTAKKCSGKGVIVEIGSWKGKSTIWLGKGSKRGNKVKIYAIDPHTGSHEHREWYGEVSTFEEFKNNIKNAKVDDVIIPIVKTSEGAEKNWSEPIEFLWIDGAHEYEMVKLDFEMWFPHLIEGGIIAFHDTTGWQGPKKVVKECLYKSQYFKDVGIIDSITFATKVKINSLKDMVRSRCIVFLISIYELIIKLNLPKSIKIRIQSRMWTMIEKISGGFSKILYLE